MKSDHSSTRIKTGKIAQDRNMAAWYRQQERIKQMEQDSTSSLTESEQKHLKASMQANKQLMKELAKL